MAWGSFDCLWRVDFELQFYQSELGPHKTLYLMYAPENFLSYRSGFRLVMFSHEY
jgi:hypothetical protein